METKINLTELFKKSICTFECAKRAKEAGMTSANTFYSYDSHGELTDGGWIENITGTTMYPAINIAFALGMLEETDLDFTKLNCIEQNGKFSLHYENETYTYDNLVDAIVQLWIQHKNS